MVLSLKNGVDAITEVVHIRCATCIEEMGTNIQQCVIRRMSKQKAVTWLYRFGTVLMAVCPSCQLENAPLHALGEWQVANVHGSQRDAPNLFPAHAHCAQEHNTSMVESLHTLHDATMMYQVLI